MNADQYARKRARIEGTRSRSDRWKRRALQHLEREAGAARIIHQGKLVGHQLISGQTICIKLRGYRDERAANDDLAQIQRMPGEHRKPVRSYYCHHCGFFHLTSQAKNTKVNSA